MSTASEPAKNPPPDTVSIIDVAQYPPKGVAFSKDGRTILVVSMVDHALDVFRWENGKLIEGVMLHVASGPAAIRTAWP
jgi:hypothetical protein